MPKHIHDAHAPHHHGDRPFRRRPDFPDFGGFGWPFDRGPGRRGGPGRHGGGRGRARRGDVRAAILALLGERPMSGYEIISELEERTGGLWRPSPGSVYPTLQLLEEKGLVAVEDSGGKKRYGLTDDGRDELAKQQEAPSPWDEVTRGVGPTVWQLREGVFNIVMATRQIADAGTAAQQSAAVEILADTRRRLYGLLAGAEA